MIDMIANEIAWNPRFLSGNLRVFARCTASSLDFAWIDVGNEGMIQNYQSSQQPPATHPPYVKRTSKIRYLWKQIFHDFAQLHAPCIASQWACCLFGMVPSSHLDQ